METWQKIPSRSHSTFKLAPGSGSVTLGTPVRQGLGSGAGREDSLFRVQ